MDKIEIQTKTSFPEPMVFRGLPRELLVFCYGSNMHPRQIEQRCGKPILRGVAALEGFRLDFFGHTKRWDSGRESLVPDPDGKVWGVVYDLAPRDKDRLDVWQDARLDGNGEYFHVPSYVKSLDGQTMPVCYYRKDIMGPTSLPSTEYLGFIREAAELRGLPRDYQAWLAALPSRDAAYPVPRPNNFNPEVLIADCASCGG